MEIPNYVDQAFYEHLIAEDELGMVVRAHIHIEASIRDFLRQVVPHPDLLPRLTYEARLRVACALGMNADHFQALKALGDIRNSFGHNLEASLTDAIVNDLFARLPEYAKEGTIGAYGQMIGDDASAHSKFQKLSARDKFVLIAVSLKMFAVHAAAKEYFTRVDA